jgi:hypothetical protein
MNFGSLYYFLGIKSIEKRLKIAAQYQASNWPTAYGRGWSRPARVGRGNRGRCRARQNWRGRTEAAMWRRAERSARDGGVPVEGDSDDRRRVQGGPAARGGTRGWGNDGWLRRPEARGGAHWWMADGGTVQVDSRAGQRPPVIGSGQEVGRGVGWAREAREEERKWGKGRGGAVAAATVLNWRTEVWDGRRGGTTRWARAKRGERGGGVADRWVALDSGRPNRGERRGLTGGPRPQCRSVALADRRARAAQCRAVWI